MARGITQTQRLLYFQRRLDQREPQTHLPGALWAGKPSPFKGGSWPVFHGPQIRKAFHVQATGRMGVLTTQPTDKKEQPPCLLGRRNLLPEGLNAWSAFHARLRYKANETYTMQYTGYKALGNGAGLK